MPRLMKSPIIEINTQKQPPSTKFLSVTSVIKEAKNVPRMIARYVNDVIDPLALDTCLADTSSGIIPYLDGPKRALCVAIKKRALYTPTSHCKEIERSPKRALNTSMIFADTIIVLLLM